MYYEFNCGPINTNDWTLRNKNLVQHADLNKLFSSAEEYFMIESEVQKQNCFEFVFPHETAILDLGRFVSCMEKKMKQLCRYEKFNSFASNSSIYELNFYEIRRSVGEFVVYICTYLDSINWSHDFIQHADLTKPLSDFHVTIRKYLSRLYKLPALLFNYAASNSGNNCIHPGYHIYHLHLELRWIYLFLTYSRLKSENITNENEELNNTILLIVYDLIYVASKVFSKMNLMKDELKTQTPYICVCTKEMWYMIQTLIDDMSDHNYAKTFWSYVNIILDDLSGKNSNAKLHWYQEFEKTSIGTINVEIFGIWIIYHLNLLYGYHKDGSYAPQFVERVKSNHVELENLLKSYINKVEKDDTSKKELCTIIPLIHILINEWWESDTRVIKTLLDYFQSRINQQYLLQAFGPWSVSFDNKTPLDILKQIKDRVQGPESNKESSFGLFLRLIGQFLYNNKMNNEPKFWKQIKGRIYIKFNINKVQDLTEDGLYNFLSMFLTLAVYADPVDVCQKIMSIPININDTSQRKYTLIYKVKLAVLLLYKELGRDLKELKLNENKDSFLNEINQISCVKSTVPLMRYYIDVLNTIIQSNPKLDKNEQDLLDGYLDRYMPACSKDTFTLLANTICIIFEHCQAQKYTNHPILDSLWKFIPSRIRQMALDNNMSDDYTNIVKLAVTFTLEAVRNPATAERHKHPAKSLFQHFGFSIMIKNVKFIRSYLVQILNDSNTDVQVHLKQINANFEQNIIQAWIRISIVLGGEDDDELRVIKNYILNITEIRDIFLSPSDLQLFRVSNTPFRDFLISLVKKRNSLQNTMTFDSQWRTNFQKVEKWAFNSITRENVESDESIRIYNCISSVICFCSPILYVKNQSHNMLKSLITAAMLPPEEKAYLKNAGKRIFSMVLIGLESLNVQNDLTLKTLLQNLFEQYLPLLVTRDSNGFKVHDVLLNCFTETQE